MENLVAKPQNWLSTGNWSSFLLACLQFLFADKIFTLYEKIEALSIYNIHSCDFLDWFLGLERSTYTRVNLKN